MVTMKYIPTGNIFRQSGKQGDAEVLSADTYTDVFSIERSQVGVDGGAYIRLRGLVGAAGALTSLRLMTRMIPGGSLKAWRTDAELDTATAFVADVTKSAGGTPIHQTAADGWFELAIAMNGMSQLVVQAKGASSTTLRIEASP